jgi:hypothetical protein
MAIQLAEHVLDGLATDLSKFTKPEIPELQLRDDKTLQNHLLECIIGPFSGEKNAQVRHLVTNIVRRVFGSIEAYRLGRAQALEYVDRSQDLHIAPYFRALSHFECCIAYSWQVCALVDNPQIGARVFTRGDNSAWERLHGLYTNGTKHSGNAAKIVRADAPTTIWLTNEGVACLTDHSITYQELTEVIAAINELFYDIQNKVYDKLPQRAAKAAAASKDMLGGKKS